MKAFKPSIAGRLRGFVAVMCLLGCAPALGQRVQFPTMVDEGGSATSPPLAPVTPPPAWAAPQGSSFAPPASQPGTFAVPGPAPGGFDPYAAPGTQAAAPPFSPYAAPGAYSPYAPSPYSPTPGALYPEGVQVPQFLPPGSFSFGQPLRFLQEVRGRYTWLLKNGADGLGVNDIETSATFAIPLFQTNAPFLVTPGFAIHFFDGPMTTATQPADLPARTYDAYLDTAWRPQITPWFGANLGVRVGAYTDFNTFNTQSIRIMGRGLGVVTFTPTLQFAAGVVYIDRNLIKILPAGGIIWTPNPDARYEILFPNPKLARRFSTIGTTDVWYYASGEYGGGSWTVQRAAGGSDNVDYNDIRVMLGLESFAHSGTHGFFEVGYAFKRRVLYRNSPDEFDPHNTLMLRAGLSY